VQWENPHWEVLYNLSRFEQPFPKDKDPWLRELSGPMNKIASSSKLAFRCCICSRLESRALKRITFDGLMNKLVEPQWTGNSKI
jgi:hypothetical protein